MACHLFGAKPLQKGIFKEETKEQINICSNIIPEWRDMEIISAYVPSCLLRLSATELVYCYWFDDVILWLYTVQYHTTSHKTLSWLNYIRT